MTQQYYNPFAGISVIYPTDQGEDYRRYSRSTGQQSIDQSPFERMIDLLVRWSELGCPSGTLPVGAIRETDLEHDARLYI